MLLKPKVMHYALVKFHVVLLFLDMKDLVFIFLHMFYRFLLIGLTPLENTTLA